VQAVVADDIDHDDDATSLNYRWLTQPSRGEFVDLGGGRFRFDPAGQFDDLLRGQQEVQTFAYRVTDRHGASAQASVSITINGQGIQQPDSGEDSGQDNGETPPDDGETPSPPSLDSEITYVSFSNTGMMGDIPYSNEDILAFNTTTGEWSLYFDGSQVGLARSNVNAFYVQQDGSILLSMDRNSYLKGLGLVRDSDIVKFTPSGLGTKTAGTFEWFLVGAHVGLNPTSGDIDEIDFTTDGRLIISTVGNVTIGGERISNSERLVLNNGVFGAKSAGRWTRYSEDSETGQRDSLISSDWLSPSAQNSIASIQHGNFTGSEVFGDKVIYMSAQSHVAIGNMAFGHQDIFIHDTRTGAWRKFFNGSDVGVRRNVNAFHLLEDGSILMSFQTPTRLAELGRVASSDIVRFIPTQTGETTAGHFEMYFKGADVGLSTSQENIDAISFDTDGNLLISTVGRYAVPGVSGDRSDLLRFNAERLGDTTAGTWEVYLRGADLDLRTSQENVSGISTNQKTGQIYLTTLGRLSSSDLTANGTDVLRCTPAAPGSDEMPPMEILYVGADNGITRSINAIHVVDPSQRPTNVATASPTATALDYSDAESRSLGFANDRSQSLPLAAQVAAAASTRGAAVESLAFPGELAPSAAAAEAEIAATRASSSARETPLDPSSVDRLLASLPQFESESSSMDDFPALLH
ncbi:MAG: Ig-like domain-containing protein, partial [Novipirellula sp. JB048]